MQFTRGRTRRTGQASESLRGFSLVELMVTLAVAAILVAIAAPSFASIFNSNRLSGAANEMVASLQVARMEAIRYNSRTVVCRSEDGLSCAPGAVWNGWVTLGDTDRDGAVDEVLRVSTVKVPVELRVSTNVVNSRIEFRPDGRARTATGGMLTAIISVCIATTKPVENARLVSIGTGSRISTARSNGGGACAVPSNTL